MHFIHSKIKKKVFPNEIDDYFKDLCSALSLDTILGALSIILSMESTTDSPDFQATFYLPQKNGMQHVRRKEEKNTLNTVLNRTGDKYSKLE